MRQLGLNVKIIGLDLKDDVIRFCEQVARDLGYDGLSFLTGDIQSYVSGEPIDMVVTLHACDVATDAAIVQAIGWDCRILLTVPCCQHELFPKIKNDRMKVMLKHGIIKERFSALLTDSIRGQLLEACGYDVNIMEFISLEHTPKNILIKAVRNGRPVSYTHLDVYKRQVLPLAAAMLMKMMPSSIPPMMPMVAVVTATP